MKENNKTKLRITQVLYGSLAICFLGAFITLYTIQNSTIIVAKDTQNVLEKEKTVNEEINVANIEKEKRENLEVTSRSSSVRESIEEHNEEVVKKQYTKIEDVKISKNMDLTVRTGLSKEDFKRLIGNTKQDRTKFFYNNSDTIYDLCEKYQINEIFFCGLIAGESGWSIASNHRNTHNYISLMSKGKLLRFSTVEEGLEKAASTLHNKYLSPNGRFYSGKTLSGVKKRFCPASSTSVSYTHLTLPTKA